MRNDTPRNIVRSRTALSYAFEAAVLTLVSELVTLKPVALARQELARMIAAEIGRDRGRKAPTWTVSKKERRR